MSEPGWPFPKKGLCLCVCVSEPWALTTGPRQSLLAISDIARRWHLCQIQASGVNTHFAHCLKIFWIHCQYLKIRRFHMSKQTSAFSSKKSENWPYSAWFFYDSLPGLRVTVSSLNGDDFCREHIPHPACFTHFFYLSGFCSHLNLVSLLYPHQLLPLKTPLLWAELCPFQKSHVEILTLVPANGIVSGDGESLWRVN